MNILIFNKLYIFLIFENKVKYIEFFNGKNIIIIEDDVIGNKKGKFIIFKNLYYIMGVDCYFEDKWDV